MTPPPGLELQVWFVWSRVVCDVSIVVYFDMIFFVWVSTNGYTSYAMKGYMFSVKYI